MAVSDQPAVTGKQLDQLSINTIRTLSMDAVQKANSGHPGTPMALAPVAYSLWQEFLRYDPEDPQWPNRDRFVLSNGHASMLLYSLLHLAGVREVDAAGRVLSTPRCFVGRHQELSPTWQQDAGPSRIWINHGRGNDDRPFGTRRGDQRRNGDCGGNGWQPTSNRPEFDLFNYNMWVFCSDGDLMEGIPVRSGIGGGTSAVGEPVLDI